MNEIKRQQWVAARTTFIGGVVAVHELLNRKVQHLERVEFSLLRHSDGAGDSFVVATGDFALPTGPAFVGVQWVLIQVALKSRVGVSARRRSLQGSGGGKCPA